MTQQLRDPYGRPISSLRVSLTQRCNFDCTFCHQEGEGEHGVEMTPAEVEEIVAAASELGVRSLKLTGGEPLVREDIVEIVERVNPLVDEVSMTTNGALLPGLACKLHDAGLRRVNISFHSLDPRKFQLLTRCGDLNLVEAGVRAALECGLKPVKLNMVVIKGVNSGELERMYRFSAEMGVTLQLIEYQPLERGAEGFEEAFFDLHPVEAELEKRSSHVVEREMHLRRQYHLRDGGLVEVVRPMHNTRFCANCNRLRVTSDGKLKPCLMRDDNLVDAAGILRRGGGREELKEAFRRAVQLRIPYWREPE